MDTLFKWIYDRIAALLLWFFEKISLLGAVVVQAVLDQINTAAPSANLSLFDGYLAQVNHVFPLTETVGFATSLFALWVVCAVYRFVKSWIPSVAS